MTITDISNEIIKLAEERMKSGSKYQNINSSIHAVKLEITNQLMSVMKYQK